MDARRLLGTAAILVVVFTGEARAADQLCDTAVDDCRAPLLDLIANERIAIDVAFWFMEDPRYTVALRRKIDEGVPVRVLVDTRANGTYPLNADRLAELRAAGIPMRRRVASGILHWKMLLFEGQNTVQFSAANYTSAFVPDVPYENYIDEVIYFTNDTSIVNSFRTRFDDLWVDDVRYADYANVIRPLTRRYGIYEQDPELNFPPDQSYRSRAVRLYDAETGAIDVTMYRITDRAHTDAMIRALKRGVPVRLLTEPHQYRDRSRYWHSWNVDRLYAAGAQIRHRAHAGLMHQKSVLLRDQAVTIFGSSNWTSASSDRQDEHNYFTVKPDFFAWFSAQFERKWSNSTGHVETTPFVPLPPGRPQYVQPSDASVIPQASSVRLRWNAGIWAHRYDVLFGTTPDPPLLAANRALGPSVSPTNHKSFLVTNLIPGTTYFWRIVAKTMAGQTNSGPVYSFTVQESTPPSDDDDSIVLYAARAPIVRGNWSIVADTSAAGGARLVNPDASLPKVTQAAAQPDDYFELTFQADAGRPYHLWIRGRAARDHYGNDSVHVQFSSTVDSAGNPAFRIGTSRSAPVVIEAGRGAGLSGWGWSDNGWDSLGEHLRFASSGSQTLRVQRREDGISIDQIVLSPAAFLTQAPGSTKNDSTILPVGTPSSSGERVLYASRATIVGDAFGRIAHSSAASGAALASIDRGVPKIVTADASPASYAELTFEADAGTPYRVWLRARADRDYWGNDSVHLQFSDGVDSTGTAAYRIGTSSSTVVNLEDCSGCGLNGWGWQDNGWGVGVIGPSIYFSSSGTHKVRIQVREDGCIIDQIIISPERYLHNAPGSLKNDATILEETP
jgi:phosphatidylserine/phosphatidylglycerophosphate/cardiolipin synthase-like enzyme